MLVFKPTGDSIIGTKYVRPSAAQKVMGTWDFGADDALKIGFDGSQIVFSQPVDRAEVFTINGAAVVSVSATSAIGTSVLPNGTYIVKASKGQNTVVKKIVK